MVHTWVKVEVFLPQLSIQVFTSVALFNVLISPLNAFPWVINGLMEAWVSVKRVQLFLQLEEIDWAHYYCLDYGHCGMEC